MTALYTSQDELGRPSVWTKAGRYWVHAKTDVVYLEAITLNGGERTIVQTPVRGTMAGRVRQALRAETR